MMYLVKFLTSVICAKFAVNTETKNSTSECRDAIEDLLCTRRAYALRHAAVKVFLSKNRLPQSSILYKRKKG